MFIFFVRVLNQINSSGFLVLVSPQNKTKMAGCPRNPTFVVPPRDVKATKDVRDEYWIHEYLSTEIRDTEMCIMRLARRGLLRNTHLCHQCGKPSDPL